MPISKRVWNKTFLKSLALVLGAEVLVIVIASSLLGLNTNRWIHDKISQTVRISREASVSADWSLIGRVPKDDEDSPVFKRYHEDIVKLSQRYFHEKEGSVFVAVVDRGEEFDIDYSDSNLTDSGKANSFVLAAYASGKPTYTSGPISDEGGTYLAAYTPILAGRKVIGLVSAEYDSAPLTDFYEIVTSAFWKSTIPAVVVSLLISYVFASNFVEPIEVLREIEGVRQSSERSQIGDALWSKLTPTQRQVFEFLGQGLKDLEIAEKMHVTLNTVKSHVKSIRAKMKDVGGDNNISRVDLAIAARGILQASSSTP